MNIGDVRRELTVTRAEKARLVAREIALVARMEALLTDQSKLATARSQPTGDSIV